MNCKSRLIFSLFLYSAVTCFILAESLSSQRSGIVSEISKQVNQINDNVIPSTIPNGEIVMFHSNNTLFNLIQDPEFKISEYCGVLSRIVQYCMWHESVITHNDSVEYEYYKDWSSRPVDSTYFYNPTYYNPGVGIVPSLDFKMGWRAGSFSISDKLTPSGKYIVLNPDVKQILRFSESSIYSNQFQYTSHGVFYSQYQKGLLDSALHVVQMLSYVNRGISSSCQPGDRRVWFECFAPDNVTVIGKVFEGEILPTELYNYKIGSAISGFVNFRKAIMVNFPITVTVFVWTTRIVLIALFALAVYIKLPIAQTAPFFVLNLVLAILVFCSSKYFIGMSTLNLLMFSLLSALPSLVIAYQYDLFSFVFGSVRPR